jgi:triosephosphate isomerase (TIM)
MIFAANFKTHHTRSSTRAYLQTLQTRLQDASTDHRVYVFPPATALERYEGVVTLGAQNIYPVVRGAYTGEIGLDQVEEFGIKTVLIGHSERRSLLGETQKKVAEKFAFFQSQGFEIFYCIGEPLLVRESGDRAVIEHLRAQFEGIDTDYTRLIVAYEPIWAIGTGRSATVSEIATTHAALREMTDAPLLYGGSVKQENIAQITAIDGVDGVLVGSASLDPEGFYRMMCC